jgi:TM2 domain-containing membrane protein YozV
MADPVAFLALRQAQQLPEQRRAEYQLAYVSQRKDRTTALVLSLFLGHFGVDRFYLDQTGLGIAKLITFGGCGLWTIIDWFLIMGAVDAWNRKLLLQLEMIYPASPSASPWR